MIHPRLTYLPPATHICHGIATQPLASSRPEEEPEEKPIRFETTIDDAWVDTEEIEL